MEEYFNYSSDSSESNEWGNVPLENGQPLITDLEFILNHAVGTEESLSDFAVSKLSHDSGANSIPNDVCTAVAFVVDVNESSSSDEDLLNVNPGSSDFQSHVFCTEEEEENAPVGPIYTKNEIVDQIVLYPVEEGMVIEPNEELVEIGSVLCCLDESSSIIIQASAGVLPLNEGSLVCDRAGAVVGRVQEVFGPVAMPFYVVVRTGSAPTLNTFAINVASNDKTSKRKKTKNLVLSEKSTIVKENEKSSTSGTNTVVNEAPSEAVGHSSLPEKHHVVATSTAIPSVSVGTAVYGPVKHATFISAATLATFRAKGSDASNVYDEEVSKIAQISIKHIDRNLAVYIF
jgi:rRNA processing protein Gar1